MLEYLYRSIRVRRKLLWREVRNQVRRVFGNPNVGAVLVPQAIRTHLPRDIKKLQQTLTRDAIYEHGRHLAEEQVSQVSGHGSRLLYQRFRHHCRQLDFAHSSLEEAATNHETLTPGAEWLLDNYHLVLQQITDIKRHFPRGYDRTLPKLSKGRFANYPRVYDIALELLQKSDAVVSVDLLTSFVRGFQSHTALTMGEIWAVPIMLRFALIENLSAIVTRMAGAKEERKAAENLIDDIIGDESRAGTQILQALSGSLSTKPELLFRGSSHIIARLREMGRKAYLALQWLEERLREEGLDPEEVHRNEQYILAADQVSIGNTVNSLRAVNLIDWKDWFESVSIVEKNLLQDPAKNYGVGDFKTRDSYRHIVEILAKQSGLSESDVSRAVVKLAEDKRQELSEQNDVDPLLITKRSHIGFYLIGPGLPELEKFLKFSAPFFVKFSRVCKANAFLLYALSIISVTVLLIVELVWHLINNQPHLYAGVIISLLFVIPAMDLATSVVQWLTTHLVPPDLLPKLDFRKNIPDNCKTAVVVQSIFVDKDAAARSVEALEIRYLGNQDNNVIFGLLVDFCDADSEELASDKEIFDYTNKLIEELSERHPQQVFFALFRKRKWNESQAKFMGWERKRGKIEEFNHLLLGAKDTSFIVSDDQLSILEETKYVITLDNDSQLPRGVVKSLVGTIEHPLNAALISKDTGDLSKPRIIEGYSLIQPRVGVSLVSAHASRFAKIFSGHSGLDPYTQTISEVYQDLFHEGSFVGKGIYNVKAFAAALNDRVPENAILSHDLFEGAYSRVALATDIELFEDFSTKYHVHTRRQHRWVRGDWQLIPWIFHKVPDVKRQLYKTALSNLARWKIIDNLRRSLLAPSIFLFLVAVWCFLGVSSASLPTVLAILVVAFPVYANVAQAFLIPPRGLSLESHMRGVGRDIFNNSKQALFTVCFIPHQAAIMLHAMLVTLRRLFITHKNMLEWETAYYSERRLGAGMGVFLKEMRGGVYFTLLGIIAVLLSGYPVTTYSIPFFALWLGSPFLAKYLSDPYVGREIKIQPSEREYLQEIAYVSWRFFRENMTAANHYLVPDNIQLVPHRVVVDRSSITNISLSLLTSVSSYDFGFSSLPLSLDLLKKTCDSLAKLERFHGHFLNWYNIQTLASLSPRYLSMVDSGNMVGYLIAMRTTLAECDKYSLFNNNHRTHAAYLAKTLLLHKKDFSSSLTQNLQTLQQVTTKETSSLPELYKEIAFLKEVTSQLLSLSTEDAKPERKQLIDAFADIAAHENFLIWLPALEKLMHIVSETPRASSEITSFKQVEFELLLGNLSLSSLVNIFAIFREFIRELRAHTFADSIRVRVAGALEEFENSLKISEADLSAVQLNVTAVSEHIEKFVEEMDFRFLYDADRDLFPIGYDVDNARRDQSYYDLLASEARLGSFVAIALGQIPQQHWFALGRPLTDAIGGKVLLSWSGTMFEYMMPLLMTRDYPGTLLSESYKSAVRTQVMYAAGRGVPWGISESGYSGVDFEKTYQYYAFGVPGLGLKRGLEDDLVISPYSTFLGLRNAYSEGIRNLRILESQGARGEYGFYEAIDYTPSRLSNNERSHVVQSYLAHHQGMVIVALNNLLHNNIFQERFHADLQVKATELLLHEKFPDRMPLIVPQGDQSLGAGRVTQEENVVTTQVVLTPHTTIPLTHFLSNSRYSLMIDNAGSGYSVLDRDIALTRWKEDAAVNNFGTYILVRDLEEKKLWSITYQPTKVEPESYEVIFGPDKVEYKRKDFNIFIHSEITISPEENVEIRKITFTNLSSKRRTLDITSYGEVLLGSVRADSSHPAFAKMFIESEFLSDLDCLLFSRRPRSKTEERVYFFHMLTMKTVWDKVHFETSRADFLGRGNSISDAHAMQWGNNLESHSGYILDPIFSLRTKIELEPGQIETVTFVSSASKNKDDLLSIAHRYKQVHQISRAFEMAWSQSSVELRNEKIAARQSQVFQRLGNALLYNVEKFRAKPALIAQNRMAQPSLWRLGISGDLPIVVLRITDPGQTKVLQELLSAHHYLRVRGFVFDLVVLNEYPGGYLQNLQEELDFIIRSSFSGYLIDKSGGVFLRTSSQVTQQESELLQVVARVVLSASRGSLATQLKFEDIVIDNPVLEMAKPAVSKSNIVKKDSKSCEFFNSIGGFSQNGKAYKLFVEGNTFPPLPWSNVISNPHFGTLISDSGGGYTWSDNSRENRLSTWTNDPVTDTPTEALFIRDIELARYWSATPRPARSEATYEIEHGFGYSTFSTEIQNIHSKLTIQVAKDEKVKLWKLELKNLDKKQRSLELFLYVEWVLGVSREDTGRYLVTAFDSKSKSLYAQNYYNVDFAGRIVAIGSSADIKGFTTLRQEFIGRNRDLSRPAIFAGQATEPGSRVHLGKKVGAGQDSCGVIKSSVSLEAGESKTIVFYVAESPTIEILRERVADFISDKNFESQSAQVSEHFDSMCSAVQVKTPDRSFDIILNGWLLYQALACRLYARTGFYQSGGAFGFRDQLQDVLALLISRPDIARKQILLHAAHQFQEGDVQHWWHPPSGKGVRTKISDDYLWLPYVTHRYIEVTGDVSILDDQAGFVSAPLLGEHDHENYIVPQISPNHASIYEHCILALENGMRFGVHGLPLMGAGDWNDGMNEVGKDGKGESVWLAWFFIDVLNNFSKIIEKRGDTAKAQSYRAKAIQITKAIEEHAWDGNWYRRAYFDDGTPLGSSINDECRIDSISQSWSVISGVGNPERTATAMGEVSKQLVKKDIGIIALLEPAFNEGKLQPGYIKGYLPGIRENGGQYTHAAAWTIIAEAMMGHGSYAQDLFSLINPINHTANESGLNRYKGEPYVYCGDVYAVAPHQGRAGWSWYTGSAGWLYQAGIQHVLGLNVCADHFTINPCIPSSWKEYSIDYKLNDTTYHIKIENPSSLEKGVKAVSVEGESIADLKIVFSRYSGRLDVDVKIMMG